MIVQLIPSLKRVGQVACALALFIAPVAVAQTPLDMRVMNERLGQLERQLQGLQGSVGGNIQTPSIPANTGTVDQAMPADVASRIQIRVQQLERLVETLTGQVEETRFEVSRMRAELQQMSNDVSYRLAVLEQAVGVSAAVAAPSANQFGSVSPQPQPAQTSGAPALQSRVSTPEDTRLAPNLDMPMSAPVQPQPLTQTVAPGVPTSVTTEVAPGSTLTAPAQPGLVNDGNTFGVLRTDSEGEALPPAPSSEAAQAFPPPQELPVAPPNIQAAPTSGPVATARIGTAPDPTTEFTALPVGTPKEQYDYAFNILRQADYARAEKALRLFLEANGTDDLAGNAQYWLGETYYVRGDFEQAAVEFLSGYQAYPSSTKGPDNLLKLGLSMARLSQTDGACTALTRLATEYPSANDTIRRRAQTERARLKCE
ncbi:MAG: tol-pal system protein YbgF [Alphaproteobacteria bacterium]|nr:tol-pal system protein YbgF [Alphaproteobacteria bacterium]